MLAFVDEVESLEEDRAMERLQELEGIGEGRAKTIHGAIEENRAAIEDGNMEAGGPGIRKLVEAITGDVIEGQNAPIDEPVTTDTNRLIRLPGSLHGGSGLAVRKLPRDELAEFDPLVDAVPETFVGHDITVEVTDSGEVKLGGDSFTLPEGVTSVPEYLGVFLMSRGRAEKGQE